MSDAYIMVQQEAMSAEVRVVHEDLSGHFLFLCAVHSVVAVTMLSLCGRCR